MNKYINQQIKAIKLAIGSLERERRTKFSAGNSAYLSGIRMSIMEGEISGTSFQWVEDDRKSYEEYSEAIRQLEDMIEILEDKPADGLKWCENCDCWQYFDHECKFCKKKPTRRSMVTA